MEEPVEVLNFKLHIIILPQINIRLIDLLQSLSTSSPMWHVCKYAVAAAPPTCPVYQ